MKYGTNSGLILLKKQDGIIINSTNNYLKRIVKTSDNEMTWKLLKYLESSKSAEEIAKFLNTNKSNTERILKTLMDNNLVVENPLNEHNRWYRLDRFINSLSHMTYLKYRNIVDKQTIMILGVGSAGSYAIEFLSKLGFKRFVIIDSDRVEEKNLIAQNYLKSDIGSSKVDVLKDKYAECDIVPISKHINSYNELKILLNKYKPSYLLSNADDADLVIEILDKIFNDFSELKILESGYNVSEVQFELIDKNNYSYFKDKFIDMRNYFLPENKFDGIVTNSGIIFQSIISAFMSAKYIFDDITKLSSANWGRFNFIENKYFFDNRFYWSEFQGYVNRARLDRIDMDTISSTKVMKNDTELDDRQRIFLVEKLNTAPFEFLFKLNLPTAHETEASFDDIRKLLIRYCSKKFNSKIINSEQIINNNVLMVVQDRTLRRQNYSERTAFETRIYIGSDSNDAYVNYIHETFHTLLFELTKNEYIHEEFVLRNMIDFCLFLNDVGDTNFESIASSIILYIQAYYLDDFIIVNKEKNDILGNSQPEITRFFKDYDIKESELSRLISKKMERPLYYIKYTRAVEENYDGLKQLANLILRRNAE